MFAHQSLHPPPPHRLALLQQRRVYARAAVGLAALRMHIADLLQQRRIRNGTGTGWPTLARRRSPPR